jgi:hypothetical protein
MYYRKEFKEIDLATWWHIAAGVLSFGIVY